MTVSLIFKPINISYLVCKLGVDRRIILKWILKRIRVAEWIELKQV